jgi:hypothetical protein
MANQAVRGLVGQVLLFICMSSVSMQGTRKLRNAVVVAGAAGIVLFGLGVTTRDVRFISIGLDVCIVCGWLLLAARAPS